MARPGRNDPCHCGSNKKYKKCCLAADEAADLVARRAAEQANAVAVEEQRARRKHVSLAQMSAEYAEHADFIDRSNAVLDLIHAGHLDEAEIKAREMMRDDPEASDGYEHLAFVYEKRGDMKTAVQLYREAIAVCVALGGENDDHTLWLVDLANKLDPALTTTSPGESSAP